LDHEKRRQVPDSCARLNQAMNRPRPEVARPIK
jgi:hypothetical protein